MKINTIDQLRELYDQPNGRATGKQMSKLDTHATNFIEKSPFLILSTISNQGNMDASPRGGKPGFIDILNDQEIAIPDAKGNNRIDSIVNIVESGRVGLLFLIPGVDETLRVNGSACITTDEHILNRYSSEQHPPKSCIIVNIEEVFLHCAKALMRSKLWNNESQIKRSEMPSMGEILKDQLGSSEKPESHQDMVKRYQGDL